MLMNPKETTFSFNDWDYSRLAFCFPQVQPETLISRSANNTVESCLFELC